jgi:hypothetical protein
MVMIKLLLIEGLSMLTHESSELLLQIVVPGILLVMCLPLLQVQRLLGLLQLLLHILNFDLVLLFQVLDIFLNLFQFVLNFLGAVLLLLKGGQMGSF